VKNPEYKTNLMKLKNFVMVMFGKDTMVDPKESEVLDSFITFRGQVFTSRQWPLSANSNMFSQTMSLYFLCSGLVFISLDKERRCTLYRRAHCTKRCVWWTCIVLLYQLKHEGKHKISYSLWVRYNVVTPTQQTVFN